MAEPPLPEPRVAQEWLDAMLLIRSFEERAGELYAAGEIAGFLHLAAGEEATIVGSVRALRATDPLASTYRAHAHALARGSDPGRVMAELLGRIDGLCGGRGGAMHVADPARGFMGGWGIVGGHLPITAGFALAADVLGRDDVALAHFGDGAAQQGMFAETLNLAALWGLPVVFLATNNTTRPAHTPAERHPDAADLLARGRGMGIEGLRCDGTDVVDVHVTVAEAVARARHERRPMLVEARTRRDADAIGALAERLAGEGLLGPEARGALEARVRGTVDAAVAFARASPEPDPATLYDHAGGTP
jgi:pyruvate dehydrogenase E1 component alpha subunit